MSHLSAYPQGRSYIMSVARLTSITLTSMPRTFGSHSPTSGCFSLPEHTVGKSRKEAGHAYPKGCTKKCKIVDVLAISYLLYIKSLNNKIGLCPKILYNPRSRFPIEIFPFKQDFKFL